jgi:hypothetical protein
MKRSEFLETVSVSTNKAVRQYTDSHKEVLDL